MTHAAPLTPQVPLLDVWHLPELSQQPEQDVESQTHLPPVLQCCPGEHDPQAAPRAPHVPGASLAYGTHVVPLQHPFGHEAAVHVQAPAALHTCPEAQLAQAAPPVPHVVLPRGWHWPLPSQQPEGHEAASQTHLPWALHSCLVGQLAQVPPPRPHAVFDGVVVQTPFAQHPLHEVPPQLHDPPTQPWPDAQVPQALPADPHALDDWPAVRTQVAPWQQPPGHDAGVHVHAPALLQAWLAAHEPHAAPPAPHWFADWPVYGTQVAPLQQPIGQDVASHTHDPLGVHSCPDAHAAHAPPAPPQVLEFDVWHAPASSQHPVQPTPPQEQAWLSHAWPVAQVAHCAPPVPQAPGVFPRAHTPFESQQPVGQVAGPHAEPSGAASVTSPGASSVARASPVESSRGPPSAASGETVVESFSVVPSGEPALASPEWSCGGDARQPARTNDSTSAKTARRPRCSRNAGRTGCTTPMPPPLIRSSLFDGPAIYKSPARVTRGPVHDHGIRRVAMATTYPPRLAWPRATGRRLGA